MTDSIKPLSFDSLTPSAKKTLALLTALWLGSVFPLFIFTDAFHTALTSLVHAAHSGDTNIISLIASDIHTAAPEIYIQKYFTLFLHARAIYFLLFTSLLLYLYYRHSSFILHPSSFYLPSAVLLGFTTSLRILGPFAGLIVVLLRIADKRQTSHTCFNNLRSHRHHRHVSHLALSLDRSHWTFLRKPQRQCLHIPGQGQVLFNGVKYASTALPYSYLPVLFGIQLTEPVWALTIAGVVVSIIGWQREAGINRVDHPLVYHPLPWIYHPAFSIV